MTQAELIDVVYNHDLTKLEQWITTEGDPNLILNMSGEKSSLLQLVLFEIDEPEDDFMIKKMLEVLIQNGVDVNFYEDVSLSPIFLAVSEKRADFVKILLKAGAKIDIADEEGQTPLIIAAMNSDTDSMKLLLEYADDKLINKPGSYYAKTPLGIAFFKLDMDMIKLLLEYKANPYAIDQESEKTIKSIPEDAVEKEYILEMIEKMG